MGFVYSATHTLTGRKLALKFLKSESEERSLRLLREARISGSLSHPNIVDVLIGESLESVLARRGSLAEAEALDILRPVLEALSCAHAADLIHRDLKPANIFICAQTYQIKRRVSRSIRAA
jgi:eukaryotic-like serine/threonine-protein kinase